MPELNEYISSNPEIRFGKPCIKGTRIAVIDVVGWLKAGMSKAEILADYPRLNLEQLEAALAYNRQHTLDS